MRHGQLRIVNVPWVKRSHAPCIPRGFRMLMGGDVAVQRAKGTPAVRSPFPYYPSPAIVESVQVLVYPDLYHLQWRKPYHKHKLARLPPRPPPLDPFSGGA